MGQVRLLVSDEAVERVYQALVELYQADGATPTTRRLASRAGYSTTYTNGALIRLVEEGRVRRSEVRQGAMVPTAARIIIASEG
jgi:DNA-binding GntR family transcriptional regulator